MLPIDHTFSLTYPNNKLSYHSFQHEMLIFVVIRQVLFDYQQIG